MSEKIYLTGSNMFTQDSTHNRGFTMLLASLVASVVLAIGISIFNITLNQFEVSQVGQESQFALYAADTAGECALYWDRKQDAFSGSDTTVECMGKTLQVDHRSDCSATCSSCASGCEAYHITDPGEDEFSFPSSRYCAVAVVEHRVDQTVVKANGYNKCSGGRRVERSFRIQY